MRVVVDVEIFADTGSSHSYYSVPKDVAESLWGRYDDTIYEGNGLSDTVYIHIDPDLPEIDVVKVENEMIDIEWAECLREIGSM